MTDVYTYITTNSSARGVGGGGGGGGVLVGMVYLAPPCNLYHRESGMTVIGRAGIQTCGIDMDTGMRCRAPMYEIPYQTPFIPRSMNPTPLSTPPPPLGGNPPAFADLARQSSSCMPDVLKGFAQNVHKPVRVHRSITLMQPPVQCTVYPSWVLHVQQYVELCTDFWMSGSTGSSRKLLWLKTRDAAYNEIFECHMRSQEMYK